MKKIYIFLFCLGMVFFANPMAMADDDADTISGSLAAPLIAPAASSQPTLIIQQPQAEPIHKSITAVSDKIDQINSKLDQVNQQLNHLNRPLSWRHRLMTNILPLVNTGFLLISMILLLIVLVRQSKYKNKISSISSVKPVEQGADQGEYDFMGSNEGISAKLDLIRAYIAMGEMTAAKEVVSEVLQKGNKEQRLEAKTLLKTIV
jgi:FimV-like protein